MLEDIDALGLLYSCLKRDSDSLQKLSFALWLQATPISQALELKSPCRSEPAWPPPGTRMRLEGAWGGWQLPFI